jgi:hypothetical protein
MCAKSPIIVSRRDGNSIYARKTDKHEDEEAEKEALDVRIVNRWQEMAERFGISMIVLATVGSWLIFSVFLMIFAYFYYDKDIMNVIGLFGYLVSIDILSVLMFVPILGTIFGFYYYFYWDSLILSFFELPDTYLTMTVKFLYFFVMVVGNILVTTAILGGHLHMRANAIQQGRDASETFKAFNLQILFSISLIALPLIVYFTADIEGTWIYMLYYMILPIVYAVFLVIYQFKAKAISGLNAILSYIVAAGSAVSFYLLYYFANIDYLWIFFGIIIGLSAAYMVYYWLAKPVVSVPEIIKPAIVSKKKKSKVQ